jgi:hypothetical protein
MSQQPTRSRRPDTEMIVAAVAIVAALVLVVLAF